MKTFKKWSLFSFLILSFQTIEMSRGNTPSFLDNFEIVGQDENRGEILLDKNSKLLWGAPILQEMTYAEAKKTCKNYLQDNTKLANISWRLATMEEYSLAGEKGLRRVVNNFDNWFWSLSELNDYQKLTSPEVRRRWKESSSYDLTSKNYAWAFFGGLSYNEMFYPKITKLFAICVGSSLEKSH